MGHAEEQQQAALHLPAKPRQTAPACLRAAPTLLARNEASTFSRSRWLMSPCSAPQGRCPPTLAATSSASRLVWVNTMALPPSPYTVSRSTSTERRASAGTCTKKENTHARVKSQTEQQPRAGKKPLVSHGRNKRGAAAQRHAPDPAT